MVPVYDLHFLTQILISGLVHVAIRNILYFNSEFILANIVIIIICKCYCNIVVRFFHEPLLGRLGNHSLHLRLKIKLPHLIFKP